MISSSKKPKRGLSSIEECDVTLSKRQKSDCSIIISSSCTSILQEDESHADSTRTPTPSEDECSCTLLSPPFSFHSHVTAEVIDQAIGLCGAQREGSELVQNDIDVLHVHNVLDEIHSVQNDIVQNVIQEIHSVQNVQDDAWYQDTLGEDIEEIELSEFNPYLFIKNLPVHQPALRTLLPPRLATDPKLCLVLDLDETLVHCSTEELLPVDLVFPVVFNNVEYTVFARKRPYIEQFLSQMAALFEIVVFTASQEVYADRLLNILDPEKQYIRHRLFRDSCICIDGNYLKDLTILGRDLSKVVIVDNSPQAFGYHIDNGIPIESWFDDEGDEELMRLVPFLQSIVNEPDVRPHIREKFKLHELVSKS